MTHGDYLLEQPTLFRQLLLFHYCTRPVININLYLNTDPYIRRKYSVSRSFGRNCPCSHRPKIPKSEMQFCEMNPSMSFRIRHFKKTKQRRNPTTLSAAAATTTNDKLSVLCRIQNLLCSFQVETMLRENGHFFPLCGDTTEG